MNKEILGHLFLITILWIFRLVVELRKIPPTSGPKNEELSNQRTRQQVVREENEKNQRKALAQQFQTMNTLAAQQADNTIDAAQTNSRHFLFQLQRPNPAFQDEFFGITEEDGVARDIERINQEILRVIPKIKNRTFVLKWVDSEGKERQLFDNEAFGIALNKMKGPIYK